MSHDFEEKLYQDITDVGGFAMAKAVKTWHHQELQKARGEGVEYGEQQALLSNHKQRLNLWNKAIQEGRRRERYHISKLVDGHKEVYQTGDERFYPEAKDGEEKEHIDSERNEVLDEIIEALNPQSELDQPSEEGPDAFERQGL